MIDSPAPTAVNLYVDVYTSFPTKPFREIVDAMMAKLAAQVKAPDVRLADETTPEGRKVAFGKWKALLGTYLREYPIPPGDYSFDAAGGGEVTAVVLESMPGVVHRTGGVYVRGVR